MGTSQSPTPNTLSLSCLTQGDWWFVCPMELHAPPSGQTSKTKNQASLWWENTLQELIVLELLPSSILCVDANGRVGSNKMTRPGGLRKETSIALTCSLLCSQRWISQRCSTVQNGDLRPSVSGEVDALWSQLRAPQTKKQPKQPWMDRATVDQVLSESAWRRQWFRLQQAMLCLKQKFWFSVWQMGVAPVHVAEARNTLLTQSCLASVQVTLKL